MHYHFHFMARRRLFVVISLIAILITAGSLMVRGLNFSVDFTGGLLMDLKFSKAVTIADLRKPFDARGLSNVEILGVGKPTGAGPAYSEFDVRTRPIPDSERQSLYADITKSVGKFQQVSLQEVQPAISSQLVQAAFLAVALATLGMILYLMVRFEWRFALSSVIAMLHDIAITVGVFSLFHLSVSQSFIAGMLTVYGYSMNDKIIVFDRVRERLQTRRRGEALADLIDTSINQVLSRTINTVLTVLIALLAVYFFGGASIAELVLALIIGVSVGTYSSVFIASPIYLWLCERQRGDNRAAAARPAKATTN